MSTLSLNDVEIVCAIVDGSGIVPRINAQVRKSKRGRKSSHDRIRLFLIGMGLSIRSTGTAGVDAIHSVLTEDLNEDLQWELGVLTVKNGKVPGKVAANRVSLGQMYRASELLARGLDWGLEDEIEVLTDDERTYREDLVFDLCQSILATTHLVEHPSGVFAIDGSGIWAWKFGTRKSSNGFVKKLSSKELAAFQDMDDDEREDFANGSALAEELEDGYAEDLSDQEVVAEAGKPTLSHDPDARWGSATAKVGGKQPYFGYELHLMSRVRPHGEVVPTLVEAVAITPAATDIVDVTLRLIDHVDEKGGVNEVLVDRHYSYKKAWRWAQPLRERGIVQHIDLHTNDQGFKVHDDVKIAAGQAHCIRTPSHLGTIPRPGPTGSDESKEEFAELIDERVLWAAGIHQRNSDGSQRVACPALCGTVGCPLRPGTEAAARDQGLPIVQNPPELATAPKMCTQQTVSVSSEAFGKLDQPYRWGTKKWSETYALRTYVEGVFGKLKTKKGGAIKREKYRFTRTARVSLVVTMAAALANVDYLQNWHDETGEGDPEHPFFKPEPVGGGFNSVDIEQRRSQVAARLGVLPDAVVIDDKPAERKRVA